MLVMTRWDFQTHLYIPAGYVYRLMVREMDHVFSGAEDLRSLELDLLNSQGAWEYLGNFAGGCCGGVVETIMRADG